MNPVRQKALTGSLLLTFLVICQFQALASSLNKNFLSSQLQEVLDSKTIEVRAPGIQSSIRIGDYHWSSASGSTDLEDNIKLTTGHILRIGSVTKTFTAATIMKLHEQGALSLDERISKWFPDFPRSEEITVRQLLNHSSGIVNYTDNLWFGIQSVLLPKKIWNFRPIISWVKKQELYFPRGTAHHYSNTNYLMLGIIIEQITRQPLAKVFRETIFEPLQLKHTYFIPYERPPENLVSGYDFDVIPFGPQEISPWETSFSSLGFSAGAMVSTANDLRRWIDSLFKSDFLQQETLREMLKYQAAPDPDVKNQLGYGLGLRIIKIQGDQLVGHTGTIPGFGAAVFYCPQRDYSIALISNYSLFDQQSLLEELVSVIHQQFEF